MKKSFRDYPYTFIHLKDRILAISTYAGRTVKGTSKCSPDDSFNAELGETIAAARCNVKVAKRRMRAAERKYAEAVKCAAEAQAQANKIKRIMDETATALSFAESELNEVLKNA